ncbi:uncharacterized protein LOC130676388 [Microplitis mediator]|uniref:uncharacterized protein LOC130676388 n=1 Tax=Microplitis mediator TaxID=375433 RepID=UPI002557B90E|nr:uncharacterized protein LOC130676388 [Microplitis mediator]
MMFLKFSFLFLIIVNFVDCDDIEESPESTELSVFHNDTKQLLELCFPDKLNPAVITVDLIDIMFEISINEVVNASIVTIDNDFKSTMMKWYYPNHPSYIVSTESDRQLKALLHEIKSTIIWSVKSLVFVVGENCRKAMKVLRMVWDIEALESFYICRDQVNKTTMVYTFNPYTDRAPKPWTRVKKKTGDNRWTLYRQTFKNDSESCQSYHFDKTRILDGYPVKGYARGSDISSNKFTPEGLSSQIGNPYFVFENIFSMLNVTPVMNYHLYNLVFDLLQPDDIKKILNNITYDVWMDLEPLDLPHYEYFDIIPLYSEEGFTIVTNSRTIPILDQIVDTCVIYFSRTHWRAQKIEEILTYGHVSLTTNEVDIPANDTIELSVMSTPTDLEIFHNETKQLLELCFSDKLNPAVITVDLIDIMFEISINEVVNASIVTIDNDFESTVMKWYYPNHPSYIVSAESGRKLKALLHEIKSSIIWNVESLVFVVGKNCGKAMEVLRMVWDIEALGSFYICRDQVNKTTMVYTFNPYTDRAPEPWTRVKKKTSDNRWTLYRQTFKNDSESCQSYHFDKTRILDGYPVKGRARRSEIPSLYSISSNEFTPEAFRSQVGNPYFVFDNIFSMLNVTPVINYNFVNRLTPDSDRSNKLFNNNNFDLWIDLKPLDLLYYEYLDIIPLYSEEGFTIATNSRTIPILDQSIINSILSKPYSISCYWY